MLFYFFPLVVSGILVLSMFLYIRKRHSPPADKGERIMYATFSPLDFPFGKKLLWGLTLANIVLLVFALYLLGWIGMLIAITPVIILVQMFVGKEVPVYEKGIVSAGGWGDFVSWEDIVGYKVSDGKIIFLVKDGRQITYTDKNGELRRIANIYLKGLLKDVDEVHG